MVWICVDIESAGDAFDAPVVAVGVILGDAEGNVLERQRWCIQCDEKQIEPRCKREFWDNNPGLWKTLQRESMPAEKAWEDIHQFLDHAYAAHDVTQIISDNPAFDVSRIDFQLFLQRKRLPMRYDLEGRYHSISDPSEQISALPAFAQWWVYSQVDAFLGQFYDMKKSHDPEYDAMQIYAMMLYVTRYKLGIYTWKDVVNMAKHCVKQLTGGTRK